MKKQSKAVVVAAEMLGQGIDSANGLHGLAIKKLHYFVKHELGLPKYEIAINQEKMLILISPLLPDSKPLFMKEKDDTMFKRLADLIGINNWTIRFAERADYKDDSK